MNDEIARAIAKDNAISIEAKVRSYSKRADGGINIGLAVHPHGIPSGMREIEIGDRFYVAMFQIDEHEQPTTGKEVADTANSPSTRSQPAPDDPSPPGRAPSLTWLAVKYCRLGMFWHFLNTRTPIGFGPIVDEDSAAIAVRQLCGVTTRSEIKIGTAAGDKFEMLYRDFQDWALADAYIEPA